MNYVSRALTGWCLLLFCGVFAAHADIKNPAALERAPVPQAAKLTINRGDTATLTLSAITASSKDVLFLLHSEPIAGKLLDPEPVRKSKTAATLRYQSDPASTAKQEVIKFATKVQDGAVSPAVSITITILDIKSQLELPEQLDVGRVRYGQQAEVPFFIRNVGNGDFDQAVKLPAGWSLGAHEHLKIPAGKTVEVKILFTPLSLGATQALLGLGAGPKAQMTLLGYGLSPVVFPHIITLEWDATSTQRQAVVTMRNPSDQPLTVTLKGAEPKLQFPSEVALAAYAEVPVTLCFTDLPAASLRTELVLRVSGLSQTISVSAEPVPGQLLVSGPSAEKEVNFGIVADDAFAKAQRKIKLTNVGGKPISIFGSLPESFLVQGFESGMTLQPGMEIPLTLALKPGSGGKLHNLLNWTWEQHPLNLHLIAEVTRVDTRPLAMPTAPSDQLTSSGLAPDHLEANDQRTIDAEMEHVYRGFLPGDMQLNRAIPVVTEVHQIPSAENTVTLTWKLVPGDGYEYLVLQRQVGFLQGFPRVVWMPVKDVTYAKNSTDGMAIICGVFPGSWNGYRISTKAPDGKFSLPTRPIEAGIPPKQPLDWMKWTLISSPLVLIFLWRWWRKRNTPLPRVYRPRIEGETALGETL